MSGETLATERRRLIRYLARGGAVIREQVGGVIGVRCCGAARTGREFAAAALEAIAARPPVVAGEIRELEQLGPGEVFRFKPILEKADG